MIASLRTKLKPDAVTPVTVSIDGSVIRVESLNGKEWFEVSLTGATIILKPSE